MAFQFDDDFCNLYVFCSDGIRYHFYVANDSIAVEVNNLTRFWVHRNGYPYTEASFQRHCTNWIQSAAKNIEAAVAKWRGE